MTASLEHLPPKLHPFTGILDNVSFRNVLERLRCVNTAAVLANREVWQSFRVLLLSESLFDDQTYFR